MIYLVTNQQSLFENEHYEVLEVNKSIDIISKWDTVEFDTETSGRDPHICTLLCAQFGSPDGNTQIVVDCTTIDIKQYKEVLESKLLILQNAKFDLQFLYNYSIIPRKIYDTMIVEQLLHLGYPNGIISYSLKSIAERRLGIDIDKTVRGEIIWRGLDTKVILYAAGDVMYLTKIMWSQVDDLKKQGLMKGAKLECDFVPVIAYLEWCGIKLDADKWKAKMSKDLDNLNKAKTDLDNFVVHLAKEQGITSSRNKYNPINIDGTGGGKVYEGIKDFVKINLQGDLFLGFNTEPQCIINWSSSQQVVKLAKILGFNTTVQDKKTGESKDSVLEKALKVQKGINDEFLKLYFDYQGYYKTVSSFGQGHLNQINPNTGRIHTIYKQLGASSSRMSCGSQQPNTDLAKLKHISAKECTYANMQQLPHDKETRACFVAEKGNYWVSCDWSAAEARLAGDIYNDQAIKDIFLNGIDSHSMYAKIFFKEQLKDVDVNDIKDNYPELRQLAKGPEFALNFGGGATAIMQSIQCSREEADEIIRNYEEGFKGTTIFAKKGEDFVKKNGYVLMCKSTGHKMYWWDHDKWIERQKSFTSEFWETYRRTKEEWGKNAHSFWEPTPTILLEVKQHFQAASKWSRMARNAPTQGTCAVMLKDSQIDTFNWVVDNGYFGIILLCNLTHDEANWEAPDTVPEFADKLKFFMENSASKYCSSIPIPAEASVGDHWIH